MNAIEVRIYNPDLELQGIIDEFSSLIWIRRYQAPGEFELHTPYSEESRQLLAADNIVQRYDGTTPTEAGVIEYIQMSQYEITVKGRFLESYLDNRIELSDMVWTGVNVEDHLRTEINNIITSSTKYIPLLALGVDHGLTETIDYSGRMQTELNLFSKLCRATALGFRFRPDFSSKQILFEVYKGEDRTAASASKVIFSETYDNISNEVYTYDSTNYKTEYYATQMWNDVRMTISENNYEGRARRELLVETNIDTTDKTYTQIYDAMKYAGRAAIKNKPIAEAFTFSTDPEGVFKYRIDYDLGDLVIVNHMAWNIYHTRRITEVEEDYEGGKVNIIMTCGDPLPETIDFKEGY